ncbi:MAG: hypothetical protein FJ221_09605 [Lentisphaerae bacterium]|nr:hypothetical protein [Lentisphaerota bacterium]
MNLKNLLESPGGAELVRRKVRRLVIMGGQWDPPDTLLFDSMNLAGQNSIAPAYEAGKFIVDQWPTEMVFTGILMGRAVKTGDALKQTPELNPVREVYRLCKAARKQANWDHPSYDQEAVLFAARGEGDLFRRHGGGAPEMLLQNDPKTGKPAWRTRWRTDRVSAHGYLTLAREPAKVAQAIESLMIQPPRPPGNGTP